MSAYFIPALATDARIDEVHAGFEDYLYRAPYKFGGKEVDRVTLLTVHCRLSLASGKSAEGLAAMPLGNIWSFPAPGIPYDTTLATMKALAGKIEHITGAYKDYAHPLERQPGSRTRIP